MRMRIICAVMNAIRHIRTKVFKVKQAEFASIAGVTQATVSRWEAVKNPATPSLDEMARIREAAFKRRHRWSDRLFFETPADEATAA